MPDLEKTNISVIKVALLIVFLIGAIVPSVLTAGHYMQKIEDQDVRIARLESIATQHEQLQRDTLVLLGRMDERLTSIERKLK